MTQPEYVMPAAWRDAYPNIIPFDGGMDCCVLSSRLSRRTRIDLGLVPDIFICRHCKKSWVFVSRDEGTGWEEILT